MVITSTTRDFLERIYSTENWVNHSHFCSNLFAWDLPWNGSFKFGCVFEIFLIKRIRNARKPKFRNWSLWSSSRLVQLQSYVDHTSEWISLPDTFQLQKRHAWNPKQPDFYCCFNWMIPNLYLGNGCFTKHPFKSGCLGFQVGLSFSNTSWFNNIEISLTPTLSDILSLVLLGIFEIPKFQIPKQKMNEKWSKDVASLDFWG